MVKRQNLIRLSITLFLILALATGIVLATVVGLGVKGGNNSPLEGNGGVQASSSAFADMPDTSTFASYDLGGNNLSKPKGRPNGLDTQFNITNAAELRYVLAQSNNANVTAGEYFLTEDFKIASSAYITTDPLVLKEGVTLNGDGHTIVFDLAMPMVQYTGGVTQFGGFLSVLNGTIKNVNYYLGHNALLTIIYNNTNAWHTLDLGGFVGEVTETGWMENCNINIYGTIYGLRMQNGVDDEGRAKVGGVFGVCRGTAKNSVFNVIGATVSASNNANDGENISNYGKNADGHKLVGGIAGATNHDGRSSEDGHVKTKFDGCVLNVAPSTIVGADLMGLKSNSNATKFNDVGLYFAGTNGIVNNAFSTSYMVNYNGLYQNKGRGWSVGTESYTMPDTWAYGVGYANIKSIGLWGASIFGDDIKFVAGTDGQVKTIINKRSWTTDGGANLLDADTNPNGWNNDLSFGYRDFDKQTTWGCSQAVSTRDFEFYRGIKKNDANFTPGPFIVSDSYSWNRLASLSGTAYFDKNAATVAYNAADAMPVDPLKNISSDYDKKQLREYRRDVVVDTASHVVNKDGVEVGELILDEKAAQAFALNARIKGNYAGGDPERNVLNFYNVNRKSAPIRVFYNDKTYRSDITSGISGITLTTVNSDGQGKQIVDSSAVYKYAGGMVDLVGTGVTFDNGIIKSAFALTKKNTADANILSQNNCTGDAYFGGVFGRVGGTISNTKIEANLDLSLVDFNRQGHKIYVSAFSARTDNLSLESSIVNVQLGNVTFAGVNRAEIAGLVAQALGTFDIKNSKVGITMNNVSALLKPFVYSVKDIIGSHEENIPTDGRIAGIAAILENGVTINNTKFEVDTNYNLSAVIGFKGADYLFFNVDNGNINLNNVLFDMKEKYNIGLDRNVFGPDNNAKVNFNNVWMYNFSKVDEIGRPTAGNFAGKDKIAFISAIGNDFGDNTKNIVATEFNKLNKPSMLTESAMIKACKNPVFEVQPGNAFYDGQRLERVKDIKQTSQFGEKWFTARNIQTDELGWFNDDELGNSANYLNDQRFEYSINIVPDQEADGTYKKDASGNYIAKYVKYGLRVKSNANVTQLGGTKIAALLHTKKITDAAEWNQVANNVNAGLSRAWLQSSIINDIGADGGAKLVTMGYDQAHSLKGSLFGEKIINVYNDNGDIIGTRYPIIKAKGIKAVGKRAGLFGFIPAGTSVGFFDVEAGFEQFTSSAMSNNGKKEATDDATRLAGGVVAGINKGNISDINIKITYAKAIDLSHNYDVNIGTVAGYNEGTIDGINISCPDTVVYQVKFANIYQNVDSENKPIANNYSAYGNALYVGGIVGANAGNGIIRNVAANLQSLVFDVYSEAGDANGRLKHTGAVVKYGQAYVSGGIGVNFSANNVNNVRGVAISVSDANFKPKANGAPKMTAAATLGMDSHSTNNGMMVTYAKYTTQGSGGQTQQKQSLTIPHVSFKNNLNKNNDAKAIVIDYPTDIAVLVDLRPEGKKGEDREIITSLSVNTSRSLVSFTGIERTKEGGLVNNDIRKPLSRDPQYKFFFTTSLVSSTPAKFLIEIDTIKNNIENVADFNELAEKVAGGSTFKNNKFAISKGFEIDSSASQLGSIANKFHGILMGNGNTITLRGANKAIFGVIGEGGVVHNLNIEVKGAYQNSNNNAAVVVERNEGTFNSVNVTFDRASEASRTLQGQNAAIFAAENYGMIDNAVINVDVRQANNSAAGISIVGTNNSGIIAGINGKLSPTQVGSISNVNVSVGFVSVGEESSTNAGLMVGLNQDGAKLKAVVDTLNVEFSQINSVINHPSTMFFVGKLETTNENDIENVWTLVTRAGSTLDDARIKNVNEKFLYNIMYKHHVINNYRSDISAVAESGQVLFTTSSTINSPFYGYVENFQDVNTISVRPDMKVYEGTRGKVYSAVYAKSTIENIDDFNAFAKYCGPNEKINGLVFTITGDIVLDNKTDEEVIDFKTIPFLNHKIVANQGCVIKTNIAQGHIVKSTASFGGFFDKIGPSGGLSRVKFVIAATIDGKDNSALIARTENMGIINEVEVDFYGTIKGVSNAAVIAATNSGIIRNSTVNLKYNSDIYNDSSITTSSINASNVGVIAAINENVIEDANVNILPNTILRGDLVGGIAAKNMATGVIAGDVNIDNSNLSGDRTIHDLQATVNINGQIVGSQAGGNGGIVALNDGVISNVLVRANTWSAKPSDYSANTVFAGIASTNNGAIFRAAYDNNADSTVAGFEKMAGIAIVSSGYIGQSIVEINKPIVAKSLASAFICEAIAGGKTINGTSVNGAIADSYINVKSPVKATSPNGLAVGLAYTNALITNGLKIDLKAAIEAPAFASVLGHDITQAADVKKYTINREINSKYTIVEGADSYGNGNVIIDGDIAPKAAKTYGTYEVNSGASFVDSWLVKTNYYHLDLGTVGFNEFKAVASGNIDIILGNEGKVSFAITASNDNAFVREFTSTGIVESHPDELARTNRRFVFTPSTAKTNVNRQVVLSEYNIDIATEEQFIKFADDVNAYDLFYDIPVTLNSNITLINNVNPIGGNQNAFNGVFIGKNHTILVKTNLTKGIFGTIGEYGIVHDIIIDVSTLPQIGKGELQGVTISSNEFAGGLAAEIYGTVSNVAVEIENNANVNALPKITGTRYGAFAGRIDESANIINSWVFMQNDRYPAVNGRQNQIVSTVGEDKIDINIVNLGGVENDVVISFKSGSSQVAGVEKTFVIAIPSELAKPNIWQDITTDNTIILEDWIARVEGDYGCYDLPTGKNNQKYNVSLIKTELKNAADIIELAVNQNGFRINENENFEILSDITITKNDLSAFVGADNKTRFMAIGTSSMPFLSNINGNNHTITIDKDIVMSAFDGELSGVFGYIGELAEIKNLKIVLRSSEYDSSIFAGGLAGINESENLTNVIVKYEASAPVYKTKSYGAVFGKSTALNLKGVYLVKDSTMDIKPDGVANNYNYTNVINVYKPDVNGVETFDLGFGGANQFAINANATSVNPFYGVINVTSTKSNNTTDFINATDSKVNTEFAAVFADTNIDSAAKLLTVNKMLNSGFNIKWLKFNLINNIELSGFDGNSISHDESNSFKATINGNGNTITIHGCRFVGINAGLIGTIAEEGVVENLIVEVYNSQFGSSTKAGPDKVITRRAGVIAGRNLGTLNNVVVKNLGGVAYATDQTDEVKKDLGIRDVIIYGTDAHSGIVGDNADQGKLNNTWLIQENNKVSVNTQKAVNVIEVAGLKNTVQSIVIDGGVVTITPFDGSYVYTMDNMQTDGKVAIEPSKGADGNKYIITDFALVIDNDVDYKKFVEIANNVDSTSLKDVVVTIAGKKVGQEYNNKFVLSSGSKYATLGTQDKPFDGVITGVYNNVSTKFIIDRGAEFVGEQYGGIFGYLDANAIIRNLEIYMYGNLTVAPKATTQDNVTTYSDMYVGVIGRNKGTIENVMILVNESTNININAPSNYAGRTFKAAAVAVTDKELHNVWYVRSTAQHMAASTTKVDRSNINQLTLVGELAKISTNINVLDAKTGAAEIIFESVAPQGKQGASPVGVFYDNFNATTRKKLGTPTKLVATAANKQGIFEWVNWNISETNVISITNANEWKSLAVDTTAGYTFSGLTVEIAKAITIPANDNNSMTTFNGILKPAAALDKGPHITIANDASKNMVDYVFIDTLGTDGQIIGLDIKVGDKATPVKFTSANVARYPQGIVVNNNNGTIKDVVAGVYVTIGDSSEANLAYVPRISAFVGTNNNIINNVNLTVGGEMTVTNSYGHLAVINKNNINKVNIVVDGAKVNASEGVFAMAVSDNKASMTDINVDIKDGAYINASMMNSYVAGIAGKNTGTVDGVKIEFYGTPSTITVDKTDMKFFLGGKNATYFIGDNTSAFKNALAKGINNNGIQTVNDHFVYAGSDSNRYDYNGSGSGGTNIWILVDDGDKLFKEDVNLASANVIEVIGSSKDIVVNTAVVPYTFNAEIKNGEGYQFNGWFEKKGAEKTSNTLFTPSLTDSRARYKALFLATIIKDASEWQDLANLVNGGENVSNVIYSLGADIVLNGSIEPIGTIDNPFKGHITGAKTRELAEGESPNYKITLDGTIDAGVAGLFGYTEGADIANIDVELTANAKIIGGVSAGAIVGNATNTNIAIGKIEKSGGIIFVPDDTQVTTNKNTIKVTNNGSISALERVGGAIGYVTGGKVASVKVTNNGTIEGTVTNNSYAGGVIGKDELVTDISSISNINNGTIEGGIAGGLIGLHSSGNVLNWANMTSTSDKSSIKGDKFAGGLIGQSNSNIEHGYVRYDNFDPNAVSTVAVANFITGNVVIKNTWVVTNANVRVIDRPIDQIKDSSLRVMRADSNTLPNINFSSNKEALIGGVVFDTNMTPGKFDYWTFTDTSKGSVYVPAVFGPNGFMCTDGIKKTPDGTTSEAAVSFDITLKQINTIANEDELKALAVFNQKKDAATNGHNVKFVDDVYMTTSNDLNLLGGQIDADGHVLTINKNIHIYNGSLLNAFIALADEQENNLPGLTTINKPDVPIGTQRQLTLVNANLVDHRVYRNVPYSATDIMSIPAKNINDSKQFIHNGSFNLDGLGSTGYTLYATRDIANKGAYTNVIIGNVPTVLDAGAQGFTLGGYNANNTDYANYKKVTATNVDYFYVNEITDKNVDKGFQEIDYLLDQGYDFDGVTINVLSDVIIPDAYNSLGNVSGTAFNGTLLGNGNMMTYGANYNSLFKKIGDKGIIQDFVVKVAIKVGVPVFQGATGDTKTGTMKNIVIINDSADQIYPSNAAINYDHVLVIQGEAGVTDNVYATKSARYQDMFELLVNTNVTASHPQLVSEVVNVEKIVSETGVDFRVTLKKADDGFMFAGFYNVVEDPQAKPIAEFANGIITSGLAQDKLLYAYMMSNVISSVENFNLVANNLANVSTFNDTITLNADITLNEATPTIVGTYIGAVIDGNGKKITLPAGYAKAVFDGYQGRITNLVIDAVATDMATSAIILNEAATDYDKVFVMTKTKEVAEGGNVALANEPKSTGLITLIIGAGITYTYDVSGSDITYINLTGETPETAFIHVADKDGKAVIGEVYGKIDVSKLSGNYFDISNVSAITYDEQLLSLGSVSNRPKVTLAQDILVDIDVNIPQAWIDANGHSIDLATGTTVTFANMSTKLYNAVVKGTGKLVIDQSTIQESIVLNKNLDTRKAYQIDNIWLNSNVKGGYYPIDLSKAYFPEYGKQLFDILYEGGSFYLVMKDDAEVGYFLGAKRNGVAVDAVAGTTDKFLLEEAVEVTTFEYILNHIKNVAEFNNVIDSVNKNVNLRGKTFIIDKDINAYVAKQGGGIDEATKFIPADPDSAIVIDANNHVINIGTLDGAVFENVTLLNATVAIKKGTPGATFNAVIGDGTLPDSTIGNGTLIVTAVDVSNIVALNTAKYHIIAVMNYGIDGNSFSFYEDDIILNNVGAFHAKKDVQTLEGMTSVRVDRFNKQELIASGTNVTTIKYYLPVNVTIEGNKNKGDVDEVTGNFAQEMAYEGVIDQSLTINMIGNRVLNGYTINGVANADDYNNVIAYKLNTDGTPVNINLYLTRISNNMIKNKQSVYRLGADGKYTTAPIDYNTFNGIYEIVPNYKLEKHLTPRLNVSKDAVLVDGVYKLLSDPDSTIKTIGDAGVYRRTIDLVNKGGNVVGTITYTHTIDKYQFRSTDIKAVARDYEKGNSNATIDDSSFMIEGLPAELKQAIIEKGVFEYVTDNAGKNIIVRFVTPSQDVAAINAISPNFIIKSSATFHGDINKKVIDITFNGARTSKFDYDVTKTNVFKGIGFNELMAMMTVKGLAINDGDPFKPETHDVVKLVPGLPYFYIENSNTMLEVGEYTIKSNISETDTASKNFIFHVGGLEELYKVTPAEYELNIVCRQPEIDFLSSMNPSVTYFENNIVGHSLLADIAYIGWDDMYKIVGQKKVLTALPGDYPLVGDMDTLIVKHGSDVIASKNYTISNVTNIDGKNVVEGGTLHVTNANIGNGLKLVRNNGTFNGRTHDISINFIPGRYATAGLTANVTLYNEAGDMVPSIVDAGKYEVRVNLTSDVLGGMDVTKYIDKNADTKGFNVVDTLDGDRYFTALFVVDQATAKLSYVNRKATYYDQVFSNNMFLDFINDGYDDIFANNETYKGLVLDFRPKIGVTEDGKDLFLDTLVEYTNTLPVGTYLVTYDPDKNPEISKNITLKVEEGAILTIEPRVIDVLLTLDTKEAVYGTPFVKHNMSFVVNGTPLEYDIAGATYTYTNESIVDGETIFAVGQGGFKASDVKIDLANDSNHKIGNVIIDSMNITKKPITVTLRTSGKAITKKLGEKADNDLKRRVIVEGLIPGDGANVVSVKFAYEQKLGAVDVRIAGATSNNYYMSNTPAPFKGILTFDKTPFAITIKSVEVDEVLGTTLIKFEGKKDIPGVRPTVYTIKKDGAIAIEVDEEGVLTEDSLKLVNDNIMDYLTKDAGMNVGELDISLNTKKDPKVEINELTDNMSKVFYIAIAGCAVMMILVILLSFVRVKTIPTGVNVDFNFSRDPKPKQVKKLMRVFGKRREEEYKAIEGELTKAMKKGTFYNVEDTLFPEEYDPYADETNDESNVDDQE